MSTLAPTDPAQAQAMAEALAAAQAEIARIGGINQNYVAAVAAVTVWDWLIQMRAEWRYIWKGDASVIKFAYIFCRYWNMGVNALALIAFFSNFSQAKCDHIVQIQGAVSVVTVCSGAFLLLLRTSAVWLNCWPILGALLTLLSTEFVVMLTLAMTQAQAVPILPPGDNGHCFPMSESRSFIVYWIMPLIFDGTATTLVCVKAWDTFRLGSSIGRILLRDGLIYFFAISALNIVNIGFWAQNDDSIQGVNSALALSLSSVLACRMVLSIKSESSPRSQRSLGSTDISFKVSTQPPAYLSYQNKPSTDLHISNEKSTSREDVVGSIAYVSV